MQDKKKILQEQFEDLDFFFSTPDEHFNHFAHEKQFAFPNNVHVFHIFIISLYASYFYIKENHKRPIDCVNKIQIFLNPLKEPDFDDTCSGLDKYILYNLLNLLDQSPESDKFSLVYIQILDYLYTIHPFDDDPDFFNFKFDFDFEDVKVNLTKLESAKDKKAYLINTLHDFTQKEAGMDEDLKGYYQSIDFAGLIKNEISRIESLSALSAVKSSEPFTETPPPAPQNKEVQLETDQCAGSEKLTHAQIALLYIYQNKPITSNNAQAIAEEEGQGSGERLIRQYNRLKNNSIERTGQKVSAGNIKAVIPFLRGNPAALEWAKKELTLVID